ncbi:MAG TPA: bifunctional pyr operon transcriptional regulator/uracil phosphoribosyltransferase PyrR [Methylococcaceae bacterium]|nr:bifunctional pyr operon transcriptional regulator/uracil phosphoribosyltransferase PyrR [Methylococcaceae bacterium]
MTDAKDRDGVSVPELPALLDTLESELRREIARLGLANPAMIGIHSGGVWIAEHLHRRLGLSEPLGKLDISFYRDDFSQIGLQPRVRASNLPFAVEGRDILLIDDVLHTGRTIRAALNEIFDYGRPARVLLGVLIERNGRQIPIRADCRGAALELPPGQRIKLSGPDPLALEIRHAR